MSDVKASNAIISIAGFYAEALAAAHERNDQLTKQLEQAHKILEAQRGEISDAKLTVRKLIDERNAIASARAAAEQARDGDGDEILCPEERA